MAYDLVIRDGTIYSRAGLNLPGVPSNAPIPTKRDLEHIEAGIAAGVDIFALSLAISWFTITKRGTIKASVTN